MGRWIPFVLAALLAVGLIARDHDRPLVNGDEAVYAEFARTWGGDPSATRWDGVAVHQRPPLYVALLAAAHALGGAGEAPLRAVSALAAAAAVLAAAALARRTTSDPRHAINAASTRSLSIAAPQCRKKPEPAVSTAASVPAAFAWRGSDVVRRAR